MWDVGSGLAGLKEDLLGLTMACSDQALGNIGGLNNRIGFWGPIYYKRIRNPQNSIGNYLGPVRQSKGPGLQS